MLKFAVFTTLLIVLGIGGHVAFADETGSPARHQEVTISGPRVILENQDPTVVSLTLPEHGEDQ